MDRSLIADVRENKWLASIVAVVYAYGIYTVVAVPELGAGPFAVLGPQGNPGTFWLFGLSYTAIFFLIACGVYCLYQWRQTGMGWCRVWGSAFIIYSLTFIGLALSAFNIVNTDNPSTFFLFRQSMIVWAAGMYYGLAKMQTSNRSLTIGASLLGLVAGYLWFGHGLLQVGSIEYTMYGFLSFLFVPVTVVLGYLFYTYANRIRGPGMRWLSAGMFLMGITYMAWAPWHKSFVYALWFFGFNISLALTFVGLTHLPYDKMASVEHPLESPI